LRSSSFFVPEPDLNLNGTAGTYCTICCRRDEKMPRDLVGFPAGEFTATGARLLRVYHAGSERVSE